MQQVITLTWKFKKDGYRLRWPQSLSARKADSLWWRHQMVTFSASWRFVRGIHRSPVNILHKGQWRGALQFSLICTWTNACVNSRDAGELRRHRTHYGVTLMLLNPCKHATTCQNSGLNQTDCGPVMGHDIVQLGVEWIIFSYPQTSFHQRPRFTGRPGDYLHKTRHNWHRLT